MRPRYAVAAGIAAVAAGVALFLLSSERRVIGTNTIAPLVSAVYLYPNATVCERISHVPSGAGYVRLRIELARTAVEGSEPSASIRGIRVILSDSRGRISFGSALGFREGVIEVPLAREIRRATDARLCIRSLDSRQLVVFGEEKKPFAGAPPAKREDRFGVIFLQPDGSSRLARAETIVKRFEFGHAGAIGGWALYLAALLALIASGIALWLVARTVPRE
jgi:hypothetical protein